MTSPIIITPPPPDPGEEGGRVRARKVRITSVTIEVSDDSTPAESGHAVTDVLKLVNRFNSGGD